jgi:hypothetical protein
MDNQSVRKNTHGGGNSNETLSLQVEGIEYESAEQFVTGKKVKILAGLPAEAELMLSVTDPWDDEPVSDDREINLAREEIEYFFVKKKLPFTLAGKEYFWPKQYISLFQLAKLAGLKEGEEIVLLMKKPWADDLVTADKPVDLGIGGIEHFEVRKKNETKVVSININKKEFRITRGVHSVPEIKKLGNVPAADELDELIDKKLTPLDDDGSVHIKGGEKFFSHKRDGSSS